MASNSTLVSANYKRVVAEPIRPSGYYWIHCKTDHLVTLDNWSIAYYTKINEDDDGWWECHGIEDTLDNQEMIERYVIGPKIEPPNEF